MPFVPYPYQERLFDSLDAGGSTIVLKARQTGISTAVMIQALRRCQEPRTILVVSRKEALAKQLVRIARDAFVRSHRTYPFTLTTDNKLELGFSTGGRILAEAATEHTGRTYATSAVILDEFAFLPWQTQMWKSLRPTAARGGSVTVLSTPDLEGDLFEQFWTEAKSDASRWTPHRVHYTDCPDYSEAWYAETRPHFTAADWAQEFECVFGKAGDAVFSADAIDIALRLGEAPWTGRRRGQVFTLGGDLAGEGRSETVFIVIETSRLPARVLDVKAWDTLPAPKMQEEAAALHRKWAATQHRLALQDTPRDPEFGMDRTGLGWGVIQNTHLPIIGVAITGGLKVTDGTTRHPNVPRTILINNLLLGIEQGNIAIPTEWLELVMGLKSYRWGMKLCRNRDYVDALAIAWWVACRGSKRVTTLGTPKRRTRIHAK